MSRINQDPRQRGLKPTDIYRPVQHRTSRRGFLATARDIGLAAGVASLIPFYFVMRRHDDPLDVNKLYGSFQQETAVRLSNLTKVGEPRQMEVIIGSGQQTQMSTSTYDSLPRQHLMMQEYVGNSISEDGTRRRHQVYDLHEAPVGNDARVLLGEGWALDYLSKPKRSSEKAYGVPILFPNRQGMDSYSFLALRAYDSNRDYVES